MTKVPDVADAAGVRTHYYEEGRGDAVVLLHGGLESGEDWRRIASALAADRRVLVPDRRGHGRTPDVDGPYTYPAMADETVAFLQQVVNGPADLVGYSDGGIVALHVAIDHPELVRSVVAVSADFHYEGLLPVMLDRLRRPDPDNPRLADLRETYGSTSPDGAKHWSTFYTKVSEMGSTGPSLDVDQLRSIERPVLVVVADDDVVDHHHTITLFEALAHGQLAIVPGTSHLLPHEAPDQLLALVQRFLDGDEPQRMMPMRTAHDG